MEKLIIIFLIADIVATVLNIYISVLVAKKYEVIK